MIAQRCFEPLRQEIELLGQLVGDVPARVMTEGEIAYAEFEPAICV